MMPTIYYFLQVMVCSAVLYAYYLLALRNKRFHQYNRFYLLMILGVSWLVPLIKISFHAGAPSLSVPGNTSFRFFEVIADNNTHLEEYVTASGSSGNSHQLLIYGYWIICAALAVIFISGLVRIWLLIRKGSARYFNKTVIIETRVKGAPFSFFHFIFWNSEIDINSSVGKQILAHEMVHVQEKHTIDKIFAAIVLCIGWANPVFWLARKELNMVHEFIADKKAVNGDASELAAMMLTAIYPAMNFDLTNPFFYSPVKRRIAMMTKFSISRFPNLRRLLILPLLAIVVILVAFRKKVAELVIADVPVVTNVSVAKVGGTGKAMGKEAVKETSIPEINTANLPVKLKRTYMLTLDVGHGGMDAGAKADDETKESEINLEIAQAIMEEAKSRTEEIILFSNRVADVYQDPVFRSESIRRSHSDVLLSIHAGFSENKNDSGIELYIPTSDTLKHYRSSYLFANTLANTIQQEDDTKVQIKQRKTGIYVLNTANRPAVLIETGFLSNENDLKKLKDKNYQRKLARTILNGMMIYVQQLDK